MSDKPTQAGRFKPRKPAARRATTVRAPSASGRSTGTAAGGRSTAGRARGTASGSGSGSGRPRRIITLYRSSFAVDNGPERRLDDPSNADFLRDMARGVVPRELQEDMAGSGTGTGTGTGTGASGDATVGLVDKRKIEYGDDSARGGGGSGGGSSSGGSSLGFGGRGGNSEPAAFTGEGQSLGGSTVVAANGGIITPTATGTAIAELPPSVDESSPKTTIQVRLLCGKRLRIVINKSSKIRVLVQHINASGDAGEEPYVLSAGFPPKTLEDLEQTVDESGLAGSQVTQKKA
mmetsp:Transcript_25051/g.38291  ORF Transcript_25051/g.38291 Transcript_25051/m.38291 type:complete len:291 (+) Transcript_25051:152-1024(+)